MTFDITAPSKKMKKGDEQDAISPLSSMKLSIFQIVFQHE